MIFGSEILGYAALEIGEKLYQRSVQQIALFTRVLLMYLQLGLDSVSIATPNLEHKDSNTKKYVGCVRL